MDGQRNVALVRRAVEEIWTRGDLDVADVLFGPTYLNHGGLIPDLVRGPEAIKISVVLYRTAFPALHIAIESLAAEDDVVELHWTAHCTPPDAQVGSQGARRKGTLTGRTLSCIVHSQIVESWTIWDREAVLRRLGIVPSEAGPAPDPDGSGPAPSG